MIPRGSSTGKMDLKLGEFVKKGDDIFLRSADNERWPADRVEMLQGIFGSSFDGTEKLPRPTIYDAADPSTVVVQGDRVSFAFIDGNPRRPIILGVVRLVSAVDFLRKTYKDVEGDTAALRMRIEPRDEANAMRGRVDVRVCDDGTGIVDVRATGRVVIRVGSDTEGDTFTEFAVEDGEITTNVNTRLGDPTATAALALATQVDARLTTLQAAHDAHVHPVPGVTVGAGVTTSSVPASLVGALPSTAATKVFGV